MRLIAASLLAVLPLCASAQTYKCKDGAGAVTYSNEACEKQGLKDAGKVRERLTTMQSEPLPVKKLSPPREPEKKAPEKPDAEKPR
ncbi:MAG: DUF4124 domain-containing protein [Clostridia bacterium]